MSDQSDSRPFPIQPSGSNTRWGEQPPCTIPWWLADEAYTHYAAMYGKALSLEQIAERGGFSRGDLVKLLRSKAY